MAKGDLLAVEGGWGDGSGAREWQVLAADWPKAARRKTGQRLGRHVSAGDTTVMGLVATWDGTAMVLGYTAIVRTVR
jgi:hypothetical protein